MTTVNPSYEPSIVKREEFRKYLEKSGVMDALTKVLVNLYEEAHKPDDAVEYIIDKLALMAGLQTNKQLHLKLTKAEERIKELESHVENAVTEKKEPENNTESCTLEQPISEVQIKTEEEVAPPPKEEKSEES
ncbi:c-Myc-binding protein homolog isoform X2 [Anthonomus grandis grandis]|uniref:c-Myc-binding protein homolog isoform X2 n=1 Tax=Anthonomus grandis grandis TaxID=2921223 RepID=UPI0021666476|nr:c-Myc-binding protein homolog isoform X2 [Anthonomus grandis grandis]